MTDRGGPLGQLWAAIGHYANLVITHANWGHRGWVPPAVVANHGEARATLDAELAAVEARIGRLARVVRAIDAYERLDPRDYPDIEAYDIAFGRAADEVVAARAALADEDVA